MFTEILEIVKSIRDFLAQLAKGVKESPKWVRTLLALVLACALFGGGIFWGFKLAYSPKRVGGVDISTFCNFYKYGTVEQESCSSPINLTAACNWQYKDKHRDLIYRLNSPNPRSAACYTADQTFVGGIFDMKGYCEAQYGSPSVVALAEGSIWRCRIKIDMQLACELTYQRSDVEARKEGSEWSCYA
ncbi:hypothetical protein ABZ897_32550 [Nonomuraea sp. NPDC046802]|uniref:hypothetical protein n=1 Tax=Nonomuraea sp. NPDC046802 TaxID=3154919 RepID=UPI0033F5616E